MSVKKWPCQSSGIFLPPFGRCGRDEEKGHHLLKLAFPEGRKNYCLCLAHNQLEDESARDRKSLSGEQSTFGAGLRLSEWRTDRSHVYP